MTRFTSRHSQLSGNNELSLLETLVRIDGIVKHHDYRTHASAPVHVIPLLEIEELQAFRVEF
jgi:hypothetical protein